MVEELCHDYANYFNKLDITKEMDGISKSIDGMLTRLDELEALINITKHDSTIIMEQNLPQIIIFKTEFDNLCKTINSLENFVQIVNNNLIAFEWHVKVAEHEMGLNNVGVKGLMDRLIGGKSIVEESGATNWKNNEYTPPVIFKTEDYFPDCNKNQEQL